MIGAVIDLANCLDLTVRENVELVKTAAHSFFAVQKAAGLPIAENKSPKRDNGPDFVMRYLDCAVIKHLHAIMSASAKTAAVSEFDTVRALFVEGQELYKGSGFKDKTHVQIAVRNLNCIKGIFLPLSRRRGTTDSPSTATKRDASRRRP